MQKLLKKWRKKINQKSTDKRVCASKNLINVSAQAKIYVKQYEKKAKNGGKKGEKSRAKNRKELVINARSQLQKNG